MEKRCDTGDANIQQYRLSPIFNDVSIIIDYNASSGKTRVARQATGIDMDGIALQVLDFATAYEEIWGSDPSKDPDDVAELVEIYDSFNYFIEPVGRFYLFLGFTFEGADDVIAMSDVTFQIDDFPTGIPSIEASRYFSPSQDAKATIVLEEGIPSVNVGVFKGLVTQSYINKVVEGGDGIVTLNGGGEFDINIADENINSLMSIVAVSFANGEPLEYSERYITCIDDEDGKWQSLGDSEFTTDIMEGVFGLTPTRSIVEVQQNIDKPRIYRAVNSYDGRFPYNDPDEYDTEFNHYLVFDASDPECVILEMADLGIDWNGAAFIGGSLAAYNIQNGSSMNDVKASGFGGTLADGAITFPTNSLFIYSDKWEQFGATKSSLYYGNISGKFSLKIPQTSGIEDLVNDSEMSSPVFYNMQGIRITNPTSGSVVIKTDGGKVEKVLIR